ncbi:MAG: matrixin family metalloprotease [Azonexus sp.]|nr:matrixin family metalloprotease [Azonexus sp.]
MFFVDIRFHRVGMVPGKAESSSVRQPSTPLSTLLADAVTTFQGFTDLPGLATAQTLGNQITLDTTAAGYTWYIDPTPFDNTDDFLPTADPTIWQAKPGTEAVGKMDLLSVLLHEYGHVLGLDHSSNPRDFMAASLPPGERRLPSAAELQLMADLVAQIKNDPLSPSPTEGQGEIPVLPTGQRTASQTLSRRRLETDTGNTDTRYQAAINPTLLNGDFDSATADWLAEGNITVTDNTITLNETSLVQTRLTQAFQINEGDHTLSFTLSDQHLTANSNNGPSDAFEVALLDANTGLPVTDTINLTRSDALLNIQTDGTERLAQGVSKVVNDDGSATYTIALPKTLADTPVLLSFDLLGFGLNANDIQSSISLRDIHLNDSGSGSPSDAPIAPADRNANVVAGQSFTFNPLAGASDVDGDTLTAEWITQPEHGVLEQ